VQRWLVGLRPRAAGHRFRSRLAAIRDRRLERLGVISLARPELLATAGNKAYRLARLKAIGLPVPDGLVLTAGFLSRIAGLDARQRRRALARIWRGVAARRIAVRSSAAAEDGADASFAGVFETVLDVERAGLDAAISKVTSSFESARAASYRGGGAGAANVLLQPMVAARWSGVLFTEAPQSPALLLVELVQGTADKLVSGQVAPEAFLIGRASRAPVGAVPPIDLTPLVALALAAEAEFGRPQDIEWAHDGRGFLLLQSRDITAAGNAADAEVRDEWRRLAGVLGRDAAPGVVLAQTEMAEMLPRPRPLSLGLVEALWKPGGGVDRAARMLGLVYPVGEDAEPYHVTAFGRLYVDRREERARAIRVPPAAARALARNAARIEVEVRRSFLPRLLAEVRPLEAADFARLPTGEVLELVRRMVQRFVCETHAEVERVNIAARFLVDDARRRLEAAGADAPRLLATIPPTHLDQQLRRLQLAPAELREELTIEALGHRARLDYELAEPRYREDRAALEAAVETALAAQWSLLVGASRARADELELPKGLEQVVRRARRFQTLKEDAKHHALREVAVIREMLLALDRKLGFGGAIFDLELDELLGLDDRGIAACRRSAAARGNAIQRLGAERPLGFALTVADVEAAALGVPDIAVANGDDLAGLRVAGLGLAEGRAIVVDARAAEAGSPITEFADGDIIVAPMIHPAWLPLVLRAGGVVAEVGGWLSHMSIVAREHNVAMIVGVKGIGRINTGDRLRLLDDGRIALAT
jgi:phosphohistidine swiveling domain-containing protein